MANLALKPIKTLYFSTNIIARGIQTFSILEGLTCLLIEQWPKFFNNQAFDRHYDGNQVISQIEVYTLVDN